jgi:5-hydroxyisourate hydrolase
MTSTASTTATSIEHHASVSVHVLDTSLGTPGRRMTFVLERAIDDGADCEHMQFSELARLTTNDDGRAAAGALPKLQAPATYRITFLTGAYYKSMSIETFYPLARIVFAVKPNQHYHVPLLISPWGYRFIADSFVVN